MTHAYHEVDPTQLDTILAHGLMRSSKGSKSEDEAITKTDTLLDEYCPDHLGNAGVSRENNIYAYLTVGNKISDITTGQLVDLHDFLNKSHQAVLRLTIDPDFCYVSDLDAYDKLKLAITAGKPPRLLRPLVEQYWDSLVPYKHFDPSVIKRPEIMITYDIPPANITHVTSLASHI